MIEVDTDCVKVDAKIERVRRESGAMMAASDVVAIVEQLREAGVKVWLDGGWGVDALVGAQTRAHDDLDCVIDLDDAAEVIRVLAPLGFVLGDDERPTRFVMRHADDRRVDFHTVTFDAEGGGVQRLQDGSKWRYPPEGFSGVGQVHGMTVPCLSAEVQMLTHFGYERDDNDRRDMGLLAERFGLELSPPYER